MAEEIAQLKRLAKRGEDRRRLGSLMAYITEKTEASAVAPPPPAASKVCLVVSTLYCTYGAHHALSKFPLQIKVFMVLEYPGGLADVGCTCLWDHTWSPST